jgi:hypothetical protein
MTTRRIGIDRLELRIAARSLRAADRTAPALDKLGRAVARQLGERLGAGSSQNAVLEGARRVEVRVPGGPMNAGRIAEAAAGRMQRGAARGGSR